MNWWKFHFHRLFGEWNLGLATDAQIISPIISFFTCIIFWVSYLLVGFFFCPFQLNFQPFGPHLKSVHCLNRSLGAEGIVKWNESWKKSTSDNWVVIYKSQSTGGIAHIWKWKGEGESRVRSKRSSVAWPKLHWRAYKFQFRVRSTKR